MNNWKRGLDKYLTTPPDDGFDYWCDGLVENGLCDDFYEVFEDWILDTNSEFYIWAVELFKKGLTPTQAGKEIQLRKLS